MSIHDPQRGDYRDGIRKPTQAESDHAAAGTVLFFLIVAFIVGMSVHKSFSDETPTYVPGYSTFGNYVPNSGDLYGP